MAPSSTSLDVSRLITGALNDTLLIPFYMGAGSFLLLVIRARKLGPPASCQQPPRTVEDVNNGEEGNEHASKPSTSVLTCVLETSRLFSSALLSFLCLFAAIHTRQFQDPKIAWRNELALSMLYAYVCTISVLSHGPWRTEQKQIALHREAMLLTSFVVFVYRDIWPLATFHSSPVDGSLGWITWSRIVVLAYASVVVPFVLPGVHEPVDPENPLPPNREQLSSLLSRSLFGFVDPLIRTALKYVHLPYEELPLLADDDHSEYLRKKSFPLLDPTVRKSKRHIGWVFLRLYARHALDMTIAVLTRCAVEFVSPIAIYQILHHVESDGEGAVVKPWFWVLALFAKALVESVVQHRFFYLMTKLKVQLEGIITELVFEHALRIRMKADAAMGFDDRSDSVSAAAGKSTAISTTASTSTTAMSDDGNDVPNPRPGASEIPPLVPLSEPSAIGKAEPSAVTNDTSENEDKKGHTQNATGGPSLVGKINNLISSDLKNIIGMTELPMITVYTPLKIVISVYFLYRLLGWSVFVGMGLMIIMYFIPGQLGKLLHKAEIERAKKSDERIQAAHECVGLLRLIKMLGWELQTQARLRERREAELSYIRRIRLLTLVNAQFSWMVPLITLLVTYFVFAVIMKQALSASIVFSSLSVLGSLREAIFMMTQYVPTMISGKVSIDRVDDFLRNTELLDAYATNAPASEEDHRPPEALDEMIGFHNAYFTWSASDRDSSRSGIITPSRRNFILRAEGDVFFKRGALNLVVGPTGFGKTSLLLALLGEMHFIPNGLGAWYHLPRDKGVAYCPQEPWLLNETIRANILFGQAFDEVRYKEVLDECALYQDLSLFKAGDSTEVGERGLTLSGGQKARVSLARAVYSKADIVLLDDVLAALDVHTAEWIVNKCLNGHLLAGRTVLLVTHNLAVVKGLAGRVVTISSQGIASVSETVDAITNDISLSSDVEEDKTSEQKLGGGINEPKTPASSPGAKLIADEEVALGHVSFHAMFLFLGSMGGFKFWATYFGAIAFIDLFDMFQIWWLGVWARSYHVLRPENVDVPYYLGVLTLAVIGVTTTFSLAQVTWIMGSIRASRAIHEQLTRSILRTTLRFLDKTPVGRIVQRFTQDIRSIDGPLSEQTQNTFQLTARLIQRMVVIVIFAPVFLVPGVLLAGVGIAVAQIYIKAQLPVKREMSLARAPLYNHFGATMHGLTSIRAYSAQEAFKSESLRRINRYSRVARPYWNLTGWIGLRIDLMGGLFSATLAAYLVLVLKPGASNTGFLLNISISLTEMFFWWVRTVNSVEVEGNSLERIQQYAEIEQEPSPTVDGKPPASWPSRGHLVIEKLSARYSVDGPDVLHGLSFECKSGEKVGIVGRTGSGKSTLTLSLLRLIPTSGEVVFDGLPTSSLNLDALRSNITIIPQQPELISGTIRQNIDPFDEHDDAELNSALNSAGLVALQEELPEEERISLDTSVSSAGDNFSIGQRQVIALARALVRRSKILILDEATASIDPKTDALVQHSLRTQFKDCTVLTIAHRLHSIMDSDKILVLDAGKLVEFDSPRNLLASSSSMFRTMVDSSRDCDALYALAGRS